MTVRRELADVGMRGLGDVTQGGAHVQPQRHATHSPGCRSTIEAFSLSIDWWPTHPSLPAKQLKPAERCACCSSRFDTPQVTPCRIRNNSRLFSNSCAWFVRTSLLAHRSFSRTAHSIQMPGAKPNKRLPRSTRCERCVRFHRRCDGKTPCRECVESGKDCLPQVPDEVSCAACGAMVSSRRKIAALKLWDSTQTNNTEGQVAIHVPEDIGDVANRLELFARDPNFVRSLDDDLLQRMLRACGNIIGKLLNEQATDGKPTLTPLPLLSQKSP